MVEEGVRRGGGGRGRGAIKISCSGGGRWGARGGVLVGGVTDSLFKGNQEELL